MKTKSVTQTLLNISSTAFSNGGHLPAKYTCEGENISPPLTIKNIPREAKSLALIMEDPDAVFGTFDHWLMWNIPPHEEIEENTFPGIQGENSSGTNSYYGPCPPNGVHTYQFKLYALDAMLALGSGADKKTLLHAIKGHVLATGEITALYRKLH